MLRTALLLTNQLLATVPNSRLNPWESWFIFNLQKSKQISLTDNIQHLCKRISREGDIQHSWFFLYFLQMNHSIIITTYILYILEQLSLEHLASMSILALSSGQTEPFASLPLSCILLVCLGPPSNLLFVPTIHISHVLPPLTTRWLNTIIQVNHMGAWHLMYNGDIYIHTPHNHHYIISFLILLLHF